MAITPTQGNALMLDLTVVYPCAINNHLRATCEGGKHLSYEVERNPLPTFHFPRQGELTPWAAQRDAREEITGSSGRRLQLHLLGRRLEMDLYVKH